MIVAEPIATPLTIPVDPTAAIEGFELLHVPPLVAEVNVAVEPTHAALGPAIVGVGRTVSGLAVAVLLQPVTGSVIITKNTSPGIGAHIPKSSEEPVPGIAETGTPFLKSE